jgi:FixJ family two-component response regulator
MEKGAVEFLFKPFRMEELKTAIEKVLDPGAGSRV